ncbi:hypothetical protein [Streptomyces sp. NPDC002564]|uniref:hypothetical protein n=1 Tax=Streptomyces sp. NPDC002564 TaxID=3364649 RepID=UPI0036C0C799
MRDKHRNPEDGAVPPRWQILGVRELHRHLLGTLDVEAGLREVLLPSRYEDFVDGVAHVLDIDAGLREVLAPGPLPPDVPADRISHVNHPEAIVELLGSVDPRLRMRVRTDPDVRPRHRVHSHLRALRDALDRADVLMAEDDEVTHEAARPAPSLDGLLTKARAGALAVVSGINRVRDREHALRREDDAVLIRAGARAQDIARRLTQLDGAGPPEPGRRLGDIGRDAVALELIWSDVLRQSLALVAEQPLPLMTPVMLEAFMNDFTLCDLRGAHLDHRALTGVLWSDRGTTWPAGIDADALKAMSVEKPAGSGIYRVRFNPPTLLGLSEPA